MLRISLLLLLLLIAGPVCSKPAGMVIDEYRGVIAYSNGDNTGTSSGPEEYQCVALVRRYLLKLDNTYRLPSIGQAKNLFERSSEIPFIRQALPNGSVEPPAEGDIICWDNHVAIAAGPLRVEGALARMRVFEQNVSDEGAFRELQFTIEDNRYSIRTGKNLIPQGWLRLKPVVQIPDPPQDPQRYRARWTHTHPSDHVGAVWIRLEPKPENREKLHQLVVRWGPWEYRRRMMFNGEQPLLLTHRKSDRGTPVPLSVTIEPGCAVTFGAGRPVGASPRDINQGWTRVD